MSLEAKQKKDERERKQKEKLEKLQASRHPVSIPKRSPSGIDGIARTGTGSMNMKKRPENQGK